MNYILLGFEFPVDGFYLHSFEIWLATTVVFFGSGNLGFTLLEYRLGQRNLIDSFLENIAWIPFLYVSFAWFPRPHADRRPSFFFFGGLSIHLSQALLAHMFSYNITWGATKKEVERSNFWLEVPKILKRFWLALVICVALCAGMVLWSLATMWLIYALLAVGEVLRKTRFPFKQAFWGLIFPNVSFHETADPRSTR